MGGQGSCCDLLQSPAFLIEHLELSRCLVDSAIIPPEYGTCTVKPNRASF